MALSGLTVGSGFLGPYSDVQWSCPVSLDIKRGVAPSGACSLRGGLEPGILILEPGSAPAGHRGPVPKTLPPPSPPSAIL